jgi:hypothetical protein
MNPQGMNLIAWFIIDIHNTYLRSKHASIVIDGVATSTHVCDIPWLIFGMKNTYLG